MFVSEHREHLIGDKTRDRTPGNSKLPSNSVHAVRRSEGIKDSLINDPISRQLYLGERFKM